MNGACAGRWVLSLQFVILAFVLSGCQTLQNSKLFLPAQWVGLDEVASDIRVDAAADQAQRTLAMRLRDASRARLTAVVGEVISQPVFVFCFSDGCFQRFGGGSPRAKSFGDLRILIGPVAMTQAFVAHEWWHAELYRRAGYGAVRKVPRWFDEGVAVWISDDPRYGEVMYQRLLAQGVTPPALKELETMDDFIAAVGRYGDHLWATKPADAVTVVYPTAAHEVRRWMTIVGLAGLRQLVAGLARGEAFETLYSNLERTAPITTNE